MTTQNPFVGPRIFEESDAHLFFGREADADALLSLVLSRRLVLFYAPSGAGKSSLIRARLIPDLRSEGFHVLPIARVGGAPGPVARAGGNVFTANLLRALQPSGTTAETTTLTEFLAAQARPTDAIGQPAPVALFIDQFEEIVTTNLDRYQEREGFFVQLRDAFNADPLLWIILVMREDFVPELDPYTATLPHRLQARFQMCRMNAAMAREAIAEPARIGGRPFTPEAVTALVDNLRQIRTDEGQTAPGEFVEPVQLQVVCYQLWQNLAGRPGAEITPADLQDLGDVDAALSQFYERTMQAVVATTGAAEAEVRQWFEDALITAQRTRGTVFRGLTETGGLANEVVDQLTHHYLVRPVVWAGGTWYELIHDRFITPILRSNRAWQGQQSPLVQAALAWDNAGRPKAMLYGGDVLDQALAMTSREHAAPVISDFLSASEEREHERRLAAQAEADRQRAEEQTAEARRFRALALGALALLLITIGAAFWALRSQAAATAGRDAALAAQATSDAGRTISDAARAAALGALAAQGTSLAQQLTVTSQPGADVSSSPAVLTTATLAILPTAMILPPTATPLTVGGSDATEEADTAGTSPPPGSPTARPPESVSPARTSTPPSTPTPNLALQLANVQATQAAIVGSFAEEIGRSAGGRPIEVARFGAGSRVVLLVGGLSAGFAPSTVALAERAIDHFGLNPQDIPAGYAIHIIPNANPDSPHAPGETPGRLNANGVDLNRNFDCAWSADANFRNQPIDAGSAPFSEPEAQALRDYINRVEPVAVVFYGAQAASGQVSPGYCNSDDAGSLDLTETYSRAAAYERRAVAITGSGDASDWVVARGIPSVFVLLRSYASLSERDWAANLEGIRALFAAPAHQ